MENNSRKVYCFSQKREKKNSAGSKAPDDITELCVRRGYSVFEIAAFPANANKLYQKLWLLTVCTAQWRRLEKLVRKDDVVVFQHPSYGKRVALQWIPRIKAKKGCRFVALIHDLESLRGGIAGVVEKDEKTNAVGDNAMLKCFDYVICHNEHMRQVLLRQGFDPEKLINLEIFDYLSDFERTEPIPFTPSIAIAGNLAIGKCPYIYGICDGTHNKNLTVHLYGINYEQAEAADNLIYHGSFKPEELPEHLEGSFGLVWDGTSAETCAGNTGNYLRYNNPHKTSLYLMSGMPVVVWSESAIADFVLSHGAGIAVSSLWELEERLSAVTEEEYRTLCQNAAAVGRQLREGHYFYQALDRCL